MNKKWGLIRKVTLRVNQETEWTFVRRQTVSPTRHRCSDMVACSALTSGSREPPPDISHAPWEASVPSQLGKIRKRHIPSSCHFPFWRNALALVPSQHVRKSLGSCSIGGKDRNSRGQWTLAEMWPKLTSLVHKCIRSRKCPWPKAQISPLSWFFSSKVSLSLQSLQEPPLAPLLGPSGQAKRGFYPMIWTPRNPCLWFQMYVPKSY